jgi:DNA-binding beta-propeller fold protein YncE
MRRALATMIVGTVLAVGAPAAADAALGAHSVNNADRARATVWTSRYDAAGQQDVARAVATSPDGARAFVTGEATIGSSDAGFVTIAYDATTGGQLWLSRYDGPGSTCTSDDARALAISPDGSRVFVTGLSCGASGEIDYATVAYNAFTGAQLWVTRFFGGDLAVAVAVSPDGERVYVTGDDGTKWHTLAYDSSTGAQLWLAQYVGAGLSQVIATGMRVGPDGARVYVTGYFWSGHSNEAALVSYDATSGVPAWTSTYDGPFGAGAPAYAIAVPPDGSRVFVAGSAFTESSSAPEFGTESFDAATGALLWSSTYDGTGSGNDQVNGIGVSPDGARVYVTGPSWDISTRSDYATLAYDAATGAQVWVSRYDGPASQLDSANALAVGPTGNLVYVTGQSAGLGTAYDYATLALRASTGTTAWVLRYDGPAHKSDIANAIAVSPSGRTVLVTGQSRGIGTRDDYATTARIS